MFISFVLRYTDDGLFCLPLDFVVFLPSSFLPLYSNIHWANVFCEILDKTLGLSGSDKKNFFVWELTFWGETIHCIWYAHSAIFFKVNFYNLHPFCSVRSFILSQWQMLLHWELFCLEILTFLHVLLMRRKSYFC